MAAVRGDTLRRLLAVPWAACCAAGGRSAAPLGGACRGGAVAGRAQRRGAGEGGGRARGDQGRGEDDQRVSGARRGRRSRTLFCTRAGAACRSFAPAPLAHPPASCALHLFRSLSSSRSCGLTPSSAAAAPRRLFYNSIGGKYGTGFSSPSGGKGALWQAWKAKHGDRAKNDDNGSGPWLKLA